MATFRYLRSLRLKSRKRLYMLSIFGLATMTWSFLFTGGILFGFLPSSSFSMICQFLIEFESCAPSEDLSYVSERTKDHLGDFRPVSFPARDIQGPKDNQFMAHDISHESVMQLKRPLSLSVPLLNSTPTTRTNSKTILIWTQFYGKDWGVPLGANLFSDLNCVEKRCVLTQDRNKVQSADAVVVHMRDIREPSQLPHYRSPRQRWLMYTLESPYHTELNLTKFNGYFNWTSTYSYDSDIPSPYGDYTPNTINNYLKSEHEDPEGAPSQASLTQKTRIAAWFVTNCHTQNRRERFIKELQKFVQVDVYGVCGKLKCEDPKMCLDMLKQRYKFYIAFENSGCKEYITEKFWANSLPNDVVPVVMGAPAVDYEKHAPPHSFIHVDHFSSPRELARYLKILNKNTKLYSEYFRWKSIGKATSYINLKPTQSRFWCNLCGALHDKTLPSKTHWHLDKWWSVQTQCV